MSAAKYYEINRDGVNIRCKGYSGAGETIRNVVITGHGFGGHKDNKAAEHYAEYVLKKHKDAAVITFNWPCHGDDVRKKLRLADCGTYLDFVVKDAAERFSGAALYGYATSFGGYLFLKYIHDCGSPFQKTALRCPAINMYDVLTRTIMKNDELDRLRKGKEVPVGFDRKVMVGSAFLEELKTADIRAYDYLDFAENILILHGTKDEVVPFEDSRTFAENNIIEFMAVENADHRFQNPKHMETAIKAIQTFFAW